jgi:hypothetical protein
MFQARSSFQPTVEEQEEKNGPTNQKVDNSNGNFVSETNGGFENPRHTSNPNNPRTDKQTNAKIGGKRA